MQGGVATTAMLHIQAAHHSHDHSCSTGAHGGEVFGPSARQRKSMR